MTVFSLNLISAEISYLHTSRENATQRYTPTVPTNNNTVHAAKPSSIQTGMVTTSPYYLSSTNDVSDWSWRT